MIRVSNQQFVTAYRGADGVGSVLTPVGEEVIRLYRSIEELVHMSTHQERLAIGKLARLR